MAKGFPIALLILSLAAVVISKQAEGQAADFTVNSTLDAVDATPGDGLCADATGACTLRTAIMESNALAGAQVIALPPGTYNLTIPGADEDAAASGDLDIIDDLTILGTVIVNGADQPASGIDGGGLDRVLHVIGAVRVGLTGVAVSNGDVTAVAAFPTGGGILNTNGTLNISISTITNSRASDGGGITNRDGILSLAGVRVTGNLADFGPGGGIASGSGQDSQARVEIENSLISENQADAGGGIFNNGMLVIRRSAINGNTGGSGGGASNHGDMTVTDTTISGNRSLSLGGGIEFALGESTLTNVTINSNEAKGSGGAIFADGNPVVSLVNSTISNNRALEDTGPFGRIPGVGGAIRAASGTISLTNTTVAGNTADDTAGAISSDEAGPAADEGSVVSIVNSVVARNVVDGAAANCTGPITSLGHNLEDANTCGFSGPADQTNSDPLIGPLADNGGPTQTHALLAGSLAIDAADPASCPATDQRGVNRPLNGNADGSAICDIGAFEAPASASTPVASPSPTAVPAAAPVDLPRSLPATGGRR